MRILMLVATSVATDTRVLREAGTLAATGHDVHIIGKQVPAGYVPPDGITVSSATAGSVFRPAGAPSLGRAPRLAPWTRAARWLLLPEHRNQAYARWARGAEADATEREFDVVHAHDFTALPVGHRLATARGVPLVYDSHELWCGRPRVGRPTPLQTRRELREEARLGAQATVVITVGEGVARALRKRFGWPHVVVVRNSFPETSRSAAPAAPAVPAPAPAVPAPAASVPAQPPAPAGELPERPIGLVYAGRLAPYRELETIAAASRRLPIPVTLLGPADETWLSRFDPGSAEVRPALPADRVDEVLRGAGLALVTHSDRWENHRLAMPNKLFHAVRAGVPVVATDVGELAAVVRAYRIGTLYRPGDPDALVRAVEKAVTGYPELVRALRAATAALSWDVDAAVLLGAYQQVEQALAKSGSGQGRP